MLKYESVANRLEELIQTGTFGIGDRMPSIRHLSRDWRVSMTTVTEAYRVLENRRLIESRPQSGFYVLPQRPMPSEPVLREFDNRPCEPVLNKLMLEVIQNLHSGKYVPLGGAIPNRAELPTVKLQQAAARAGRRHEQRTNSYEKPDGALELRTEIARQSVSAGMALHPDDIIITNGCHEALTIALSAITEPGDVIALESPAFYGTIFNVLSQDLKILEVPASHQSGISLEALEFAFQNHRVKALITISNFHNPLGSLPSDESKKKLISICEKYGVVLIEDDIYGELQFTGPRPHTIKSFDTNGTVILCSSFSKNLAPGYRVGWIVPGPHYREMLLRKMLLNFASPSVTQLALAMYLEEESFEHHLRRMRRSLKTSMNLLREMIHSHFPSEIRITDPKGGMVLWLELPDHVNSISVYEEAMKAGICVAPGALFSQNGHCDHCLRLNASMVTEDFESHLKKLGTIIARCCSKTCA